MNNNFQARTGRLRFFLFLTSILVLLGGYYLLVRREDPLSGKSLLESVSQMSIIPTQTPSPFVELTIPFLRNRIYESSLGPLSQVAKNNSYTSYVTSYTSDGLKINGLLTQPSGVQPLTGWPAIVFVHGYIPPEQYRTQEKYVDYISYLARNGFVVFKIDLRGHGSSEGEPGGAYYSSDYVIDVLNAYAALEKNSFVDPKQIGLWGHSMAGNVVLRAVAAKPGIPAAVIWAGAVYSYEDFQKYGISDNSYRSPGLTTERQKKREQLFNTYGQFSKDSEFWKQVAPTNYLNEMTTAIQLHHAQNDNVVNIGYSRDLYTLLNSSFSERELYEYPEGGHNISGASFSLAMRRTVEFFKDHLGNQ